MDESAAQQRARSLIAVVNPITIPVSVADYVRHVEGVLRIEDDMEANEPGMSFISKGKLHVCVNRRDCPERQRFTICHEVAHHVLGIPSDHNAVPWWSYAKRSPNEILCDVFAAELLLPWKLFKPHVDAATPGFPVLDQLAAQFEASVTCTGSRFAIAANDHNLNIPRYVEPKVDQELLTVEEATQRLRESTEAAFAAEETLIAILTREGLLTS